MIHFTKVSGFYLIIFNRAWLVYAPAFYLISNDYSGYCSKNAFASLLTVLKSIPCCIAAKTHPQ